MPVDSGEAVVTKVSAIAQYSLQNEGETYVDLLEILEKYIDKVDVTKPFLIKNGVKVLL